MNQQFSINAGRMQIVSPAPQQHLTRCRGCGKTVDFVTFAEASEIVGTTIEEIIVRAATGGVHVAVRPEALLVCLNSLLAVDFRSLPKPFPFAARKTGKRTQKTFARFKIRH